MPESKIKDQESEGETKEENTGESEAHEMHDFTPIGKVVKNLIRTELLIADKQKEISKLKDDLKEAKNNLKDLNSDREGFAAAIRVRGETFEVAGEQFTLDDYIL